MLFCRLGNSSRHWWQEMRLWGLSWTICPGQWWSFVLWQAALWILVWHQGILYQLNCSLKFFLGWSVSCQTSQSWGWILRPPQWKQEALSDRSMKQLPFLFSVVPDRSRHISLPLQMTFLRRSAAALHLVSSLGLCSLGSRWGGKSTKEIHLIPDLKCIQIKTDYV